MHQNSITQKKSNNNGNNYERMHKAGNKYNNEVKSELSTLTSNMILTGTKNKNKIK